MYIILWSFHRVDGILQGKIIKYILTNLFAWQVSEYMRCI